MQYHRHIDGLRALAIVPVMLFHSGLGGLSGGYVGVDVFFVISGFLITTLLLRDLNDESVGRLSLATFYERRVRRIVPALTVVLVCNLVVGLLTLSAEQLRELAISALWVVGFVSNVHFYLDTGYFATTAEERPLLHTWSLAVEEQYYLLFPLLLAVLVRAHADRRRLLMVFGAVALLSLLAAEYLVRHDRTANFYLIPSRIWELMVGSMLALVGIRPQSTSRWVNECMAWTGLALLAYAMFRFHNNTPFPSLHALIPVSGTALILIAASPGNSLGRLLSSRPLVALGLVSYSLYLWHQPILAFLRMKTLRTPSQLEVGGALAIATLCALVSYRIVELPFRDRSRFSRRTVFASALASGALIAAVSGVLWAVDGWPQRFSVPDYRSTMKHSPWRSRCHTSGERYLPPAQACRSLPQAPRWAVFGDSHGVEVAYALAKRVEMRGDSTLSLTFSYCPPALLFEASTPGCTRWTREALELLESSPGIQTVLLAYRHSVYLFGDQLPDYPLIPTRTPTFLRETAGLPASSAELARATYWSSFAAIVERLRRRGKTVVVVYPVPELPTSFAKAASAHSIFSRETLIDLQHATALSYYRARHHFILERLDALPYDEGLARLRPQQVLCDAHFCSAQVDGRAMYFDDNHLSIAGAERLVETLLP